MKWGGSTIVSHPEGLDLSHIHDGRGLEVRGSVEGPGCGLFGCSTKRVNLSFSSFFFVEPEDLPPAGHSIYSQPTFGFSGHLTIGGEDESAVGIRLSQTVYYRTTDIASNGRRLPRYVTGNGVAKPIYEQALPRLWWVMPEKKGPPARLWIALNARIQIYIKGIGSFQFWPYNLNDWPIKGGEMWTESWDLQYEGVHVTVSPASAHVLLNEKEQFTASVSGASDDVAWSASKGTIDANGLFTALSPGKGKVRATSVAHPGVWDESSVLVEDPYL
ncbi:MAG: Ig-like domain-containing protein [Sandaracinaceae bacterium]